MRPSWAAALCLAACAPEPAGGDYALDRTPRTTSPASLPRAPAAAPQATPAVLYLNYEGGAITRGASDDAVTSTSQLGAAAAWPAFDKTVTAPSPQVTRAQAI